MDQNAKRAVRNLLIFSCVKIGVLVLITKSMQKAMEKS